jgi:hypothetical protein
MKQTLQTTLKVYSKIVHLSRISSLSKIKTMTNNRLLYQRRLINLYRKMSNSPLKNSKRCKILLIMIKIKMHKISNLYLFKINRFLIRPMIASNSIKKKFNIKISKTHNILGAKTEAWNSRVLLINSNRYLMICKEILKLLIRKLFRMIISKIRT